VVRAARAVDTATHPDHRGKGVFSALTRAALDELRGDDVQFVFNTPNRQSLPGYLKLGWTKVGRLPVAVRPSSPAAAWRMVRSRVPAERESLDTTAGAPISDLLDSAQLGSLLTHHRTGRRGLRTRRTVAYLQWRYGRPWLKYRAILGALEPKPTTPSDWAPPAALGLGYRRPRRDLSSRVSHLTARLRRR
jgi:hypothetical protein